VNREERIKLLSGCLAEASRKTAEADATQAQIERITAAVKSKLAHRIHASDDDDLTCPSCGYKGPESDFEPDTDDDPDGFRTDDVTSDSDGNADDVNELDAAGKSRVVAELLKNHKRRR
jgi:hypothetical protein